jgi:hypothetical protein
MLVLEATIHGSRGQPSATMLTCRLPGTTERFGVGPERTKSVCPQGHALAQDARAERGARSSPTPASPLALRC